MKIDQSIFRAYDIRGTYPKQLNQKTAELIGKGFGSYLKQKTRKKTLKIALGRDCRTHSPELFEGFISGLLSTGCQVTDLGTTPSPYVYFAVTSGKFDGGCNITASHNPGEFNGFKLMTKDAHAVFGDQLQKVYKIIDRGRFVMGKGVRLKKDYRQNYLKKIKSVFSFARPLRVVIDTANGVAGTLYPKILRELGHSVKGLYTDPDGSFPNHEADPIVESNLTELKKNVVKNKADLGLAFDGDGDRVALVTEKGEFINSDHLSMLLSQDILKRRPKGTIVFTVANSQALFDLVKQWGGRPVMCKVGHSFVEDAMTRNQAVLGGEQSGHFFLPEDYYPFDDALITACRILRIVSDSKKPVSELFEDFPKTFSVPELRPYCPDDRKFEVLKQVITFFKNQYPNTTMDGIRMSFGHGGWCGIRVSNTSPRISVIMEAESKKQLEEIKKLVLGHLKKYPEIDWYR